jgi:hypothetical protein
VGGTLPLEREVTSERNANGAVPERLQPRA